MQYRVKEDIELFGICSFKKYQIILEQLYDYTDK